MGYLAYDIGASGGKLFWGTFDGEKLSYKKIYGFNHRPVALGNFLYWDFSRFYTELLDGLQYSKKFLRSGESCSLGIDSFSNDYSFIDESGRLLEPMRCYRDNRTSLCSEEIYTKISKQALYKYSGNQIAPFNSAMQLAATKIEQPTLLLKPMKLLFLPDLIIYYLTGNKTGERTICSVSQLYDFKTKNWCHDIFSALDIPEQIMPEIVDSGTIIGSVSKQIIKETGLENLSITKVCEHDTASAYLASPHNSHAAIISSGTWALVGTENANPIINDYGYKYNIANEGSIEGHHRLLKNVMGNWLFQQLRESYSKEGLEYSYSDFSSSAMHCRPFSFLIDVDDQSFFSPGNIKEKILKSGRKWNNRAPEHVGEFCRCIYESLALKYRWCIERLENLCGYSLDEITILGGGSLDSFSCQLISNICQKPVTAASPDATALGNIIVQMVANKELKSVEEGRDLLKLASNYKRYEPQVIQDLNNVYEKFCSTFALNTCDS